MELTGIQKFKAMNDKLPNFKECEGLVVKPIAFLTSTYEGQDGKDHTKLVVLNGNDKQMYKTEVKAFIEKFMQYDASFGDLTASKLQIPIHLPQPTHLFSSISAFLFSSNEGAS